ncbi:MAG: hypothetical protein J6U64_03485 [Alphaproteobacteria bacterium]|nr:hypothetical protein [Alphaproteobacteria bacterium]
MSVEKSFLKLKEIHENGKIGGAWLIYGEKGVGKRTLLKRFCGYLLSGEDKPLDFHQDLRWISCDYTDKDKKEILKSIKEGRIITEEMERGFKRKSEITVDDIRSGINFLSMTSSGDKWRILVIDSADDMNENAANALLKVLEEPPSQSIIFLVSHNKGRLLPTIKSRCRELTVLPLSKEETKKYIKENYPDTQDIDVLVEFSCGSIGKIKNLLEDNEYENYLKTYEFLTSEKNKIMDIYDFCGQMSEENPTTLKDFLSFFVLQKTKEGTKTRDYLDLWDEMQQTFREMDNLYLDKKNTFADLFFKIGALS